MVRFFGVKQLKEKRFETVKELTTKLSALIDSSEAIGEVSKLHYPTSMLPFPYEDTEGLFEQNMVARRLSHRDIYKSNWDIPGSMDDSSDYQQSIVGDRSEEGSFRSIPSTQEFLERLHRLRFDVIPHTPGADASASWGSVMEAQQENL